MIRVQRGGPFTAEEISIVTKRRRNGDYAHTATEAAMLTGRKYSQVLRARSQHAR